MVATFMVVLDSSVANVALPHIAGNLSATTDEATWVLTMYLTANAVILPATGWLAIRMGRRRFLVFSVVAFTLASLLCGAASTLGLLVFARILQGIGGGGLQPVAQAVLLETFPPVKRGVAMAFYGMGVVVAPIIGPTLGGWITDNYSWRWIFYINLPIGILAVLMILAFVEDPPYLKAARQATIDYRGVLLMVVGIGSLQLVLDKGQREDWFSSDLICGLAVLAVVTLVIFLVAEWRTPHPIVDLRILHNRNFTVGTAMGMVMGAVLYSTTALLPIFLQTLMGYPAMNAGLAVTPRGVGALFSMMLVGRLVGKVDERLLVGIGFAFLGYSSWMLGDITLDISMSSVVWPNVLSGLAMGFVFVPLTTAAMGTLSNEEMGNASGIYNLMRNIGGAAGIALTTTFLARFAQAHQVYLVAHMTPFDPIYQQHLHAIASGLATRMDAFAAGQAAQAVMYGILQRQCALAAFVETFRWLAFLSFGCIPLLILFHRAQPHEAAVKGDAQ